MLEQSAWGDFAVQWTTKEAITKGEMYRMAYESPETESQFYEELFSEDATSAASKGKLNKSFDTFNVIACECCKVGMAAGGTLCQKCIEQFYGP